MKDIPKQRISTTELARNLANVIDQVRISRTRMTITKGNHEVAHLIPVPGNGTTLADLQALLENSPLSAVEQLNFSKDIQTIRDAASLPESPWE